MPVDRVVLRARVSEVVFTVSELKRLTSKPLERLSVDEKYAIRYNVVVLAEALVSLHAYCRRGIRADAIIVQGGRQVCC